jgi:hypothetical protein
MNTLNHGELSMIMIETMHSGHDYFKSLLIH